MDLLQRIQRWYTINCDGDWEHDNGVSIWHGISVQTLDNPGWIVSINLKDTCLDASEMPYVLHERSTTNWFGYKVEKGNFEGVGGPENLTEILTYFLDIFLPERINSEITYKIRLPVRDYEGMLWLKAEATVLSESMMRIVSINNPRALPSYDFDFINEPDLSEVLESNISELNTDFNIGDLIAPQFLDAGDNTFLIAPAKK
ncbi:immunity 53 family protein [Hymenobacter sp. UYCo722]|uniref:immunity 53 family protein n=1 Tax=Hymenobacter sp. UYCo722 TaxID=3156335 RepID=UPI003397AC11